MATEAGADAQELVSTARDLVRVPTGATSGLWPRAAALLTRQSIEAAMGDLWRLRAPGMLATTSRCQLLCLGDFLHDRDLARRVSVAWDGLSRACHVRVYELPPAVEELSSWMSCAWDLAEAVADLAQ